MGLYESNGLGGAGLNEAGQPISSSWVSQAFGFNYPTYGAQLTLSLPLKNRAAKAEMGTALVSRRNDLYTQRRVHEQVMLDVSNSVHLLEQAKLGIAASKEALDLAQKTMAAEQRKYELGSSTIFLVLEAQTEMATAQENLLQAEVGYQMAVAAVDHATGVLLEPYHMQIAELTR
jgi:outer membrane protein